ncbi:MAG: nitroreductase [Gammaproteobacteria bacterium]|nr:nitroreductase [Gammaproteobacteria bacterium]
MNVTDALLERKSTRAFLQKTVDRSLIEKILANASHAPSGTNTQPWQVAVVSGKQKEELQTKLETAFRNGDKAHADYQYYPLEWQSPYKDRRRACGLQMYKTLDIKRDDKQKQLDQWAKNFRAFDAPVMLLFFLDPVMQAGSYLDYGMFLQSLMLSAQAEGLATCPQAALADYPEIVKQQLGYANDSVLLCGMALGYEDKSALVNSYRTSREKVEAFTRFFD